MDPYFSLLGIGPGQGDNAHKERGRREKVHRLRFSNNSFLQYNSLHQISVVLGKTTKKVEKN